MPLYYFHLRNGEDILLDEDGREMSSMGEIEVAALQEARAIISHDALRMHVRNLKAPLQWQFRCSPRAVQVSASAPSKSEPSRRKLGR